MDWVDRIGRRVRLRDLHILLAVAEAGSMSKAASRLAISHPVVSKTISDLEHALGTRLLDRTSQGVELTIYGQALLKCGVAVFDELRQGMRQLEFLDDPTSGELRVGSPEILTAGFLPAVVDRFSRSYPKVRLGLQVVQTSPGALQFRALRERTIDVLFTRTMIMPEDDLVVESLFDEPFVAVAGKQYRRARSRRRLALHDLIEEPWVLPPYDSVPGALVAEVFRTAGLDPPVPAMATLSVQLTTNLIITGRYLGILPRSAAQFSQRAGLEILPLKLADKRLGVGVVTVRNRTLSPLAAHFIDYARQTVAQQGKRRSA